MAIKLADLLERENTAYPVVEAHEKSIIGFYNGASEDSAQAMKLYYNSTVRTHLSSDGTSGNKIKLTALPYGGDGGSTTAGPGDERVVPTDRGGIITMLDEKLLNDSQLVPANNFCGAYLVQTIYDGSVTDAAREALGRTSELIQQFNRYPSINGSDAAALDQSGNFYLSGYDDADNMTKKINLNDLGAALAGIIGQQLVTDGVFTQEQAGGSGLEGDLNGDGEVSTSDFLEFLAIMGNGLTGYNASLTIMSEDDEESAQLTPPSISGVTAPYTHADDFVTFNLPSPSYTTDGTAYGWTSVNTPSAGSAHYIEFDGLTVTGGFFDDTYSQYTPKVYCTVEHLHSGPDVLYGFAQIEVEYDDASNTVQNATFYMYGADTEGNTTIGIPNSAQTGESTDVPVGETLTSVMGVNLGPGVLALPVATVNDTDTLLGGIKMGDTVQGGNIDRIKVRVFFASLNEYVKVTVQDVKLEIDSQSLTL